LPTWHAQREAGALGSEEQTAAARTAIHAGTPTVAHADSLGRTFLTIAHNKFKRSGTPPADPPTEEFYSTRVIFDIEGNQRDVIDASDRIVMRYDYDMLGRRIHQASMEAGERWTLANVAGKPIYACGQPIISSAPHTIRCNGPRYFPPRRRRTERRIGHTGLWRKPTHSGSQNRAAKPFNSSIRRVVTTEE
jgi:hypothetical protein